jgi:hypothetical protein
MHILEEAKPETYPAGQFEPGGESSAAGVPVAATGERGGGRLWEPVTRADCQSRSLVRRTDADRPRSVTDGD